MQVIPAIDLERGRSRVVFWPGVSSGVGAPTDRPDRIAEHFVGLGAPLIHLIDFDGARAGTPANLETVGAVAARVATPIQVAGGVDTPDGIRLAFAAGATRVVVGLAVADDVQILRDCLAVAGDWLAVGLDARSDRLAAFPWRRPRAPTLGEIVGELVGLGVVRLVIGHGGGSTEMASLAAIRAAVDVEVLVAGGVRDLDGIRRLRDAGVAGIILGEALLSGAIEYTAAREAAT
jgi:phosphoribosylformimino-5-aminoimidazole carboxamide ribotide isomerase